MWLNANPVITQFRTQLLACTAVTDAGLVEESFHYPSFSFSTENDPDEIPACLLTETPQQRERYAEGAIPLISGTLTAKFYLPASLAENAGWVETFVRSVVYQLGAQYYGLAWKSFNVTLSSNPTPAQRAADVEAEDNDLPPVVYREAVITAHYGLSRG